MPFENNTPTRFGKHESLTQNDRSLTQKESDKQKQTVTNKNEKTPRKKETDGQSNTESRNGMGKGKGKGKRKEDYHDVRTRAEHHQRSLNPIRG